MPTDEIAKKKWLSEPSHIRKMFEGNVFCVSCGLTTIVNYEVNSVNFTIVLEGYCKKCNGKVARVID
jgi:hypothetical protein